MKGDKTPLYTLPAYVVSLRFEVGAMAGGRTRRKRWEKFLDRLMTTLLDYEPVGKYDDSSCASRRYPGHHELEVSVLVAAVNDAVAYRLGWEVIWRAVCRSADRLVLRSIDGRVVRDDWVDVAEGSGTE